MIAADGTRMAPRLRPAGCEYPRSLDEAQRLMRSLVVSTARRFDQWYATKEVLEVEGMIGVWRAWERWDRVRPFPPLATKWLQGQMMHELRKAARRKDELQLWDRPDWGDDAGEDPPKTARALISDPFGRALRCLDEENEMSAQAAARPRNESLSARELQVLRCLSAGMSAKEIGVELEVSERTAQFHGDSIYRKLGASGRHDAVRIGVEAGLIPCPFCSSKGVSE